MILVTGGTGLLGTHVLLELLSRGKSVRALKRQHSDLDQVKKVFQFYLKEQAEEIYNKIEWVEGDVLDVVSLADAISGCHVVYHCAGMVSFRKRDFRQMWKVNKEGTANVVNVCLTSGVDHLCFVSSTAAIGKDRVSDIFTEDHRWTNEKENSNYSVTKYSAEMEVWRGVEEGLNAVIVNPSVILGPGNWNESSISIFKVVKKGLRFYTPGMNAFVDVRDVATVMAELSDRGIFNKRFLVISENVFFKDLFFQIATAFGVKPPSILVKPWMASLAWKVEGFLRFFFGRKQNITRETAQSSMSITRYSNQKIKQAINFQFIPIEDSIQHAVKYFNNQDLIKP